MRLWRRLTTPVSPTSNSSRCACSRSSPLTTGKPTYNVIYAEAETAWSSHSAVRTRLRTGGNQSDLLEKDDSLRQHVVQNPGAHRLYQRVQSAWRPRRAARLYGRRRLPRHRHRTLAGRGARCFVRGGFAVQLSGKGLRSVSVRAVRALATARFRNRTTNAYSRRCGWKTETILSQKSRPRFWATGM